MSFTLPKHDPLSNSSSMTHSPCSGERVGAANLAPVPAGKRPPRVRKVMLRFMQADIESERLDREIHKVTDVAEVTGDLVKKLRNRNYTKEKKDRPASTTTPARIDAVASRAAALTASRAALLASSRAAAPTTCRAASPTASPPGTTNASLNKLLLPSFLPLRAPTRRTRATVALVIPSPSLAPRRSSRKGSAAATKKEREGATETAWLKETSLKPRVMGAACDRAAGARGALERRRIAASFPVREAVDSDEEEWLAEEVGKYFRTATPMVEAMRAQAVGGLNVVGKPLSLSGKGGGKLLQSEETVMKKLGGKGKNAPARVRLSVGGKGKNAPAHVRLSVARRPTVPFHDTPAKLVVLRLANADVEHDLMAITGRDLKQERLTLSPRSCKGNKGEASRAGSGRAAAEEARTLRVIKRTSTAITKAGKGPNGKATAKMAAGKADAAKAAAYKAARSTSGAIAVAAEEASLKPTGLRGGSARKMRTSEVQEEVKVELTVRRRTQPSKRGKPSGGFGGDTKLFAKHIGKKGWVLCRKCGGEVWPPNCGKHAFVCS